MSCHDIGRGMSAVSKTVLDLYEEKQISKESAMKLILACRKGVHWCDGNEGEALEHKNRTLISRLLLQIKLNSIFSCCLKSLDMNGSLVVLR